SDHSIYNNIPFFTAYQPIDTLKGSFYEQFSEDPLSFSPERGRQDIYDKNFRRLASKQDSSFQHPALSAVDAYLDAHPEAGIQERRVAIRTLLQSGEVGNEDTPELNEGRTPREELEAHMADMGFEQFTGKDGKKGVKKEGVIVLPPIYEIV